jgi:hypothetical protein
VHSLARIGVAVRLGSAVDERTRLREREMRVLRQRGVVVVTVARRLVLRAERRRGGFVVRVAGVDLVLRDRVTAGEAPLLADIEARVIVADDVGAADQGGRRVRDGDVVQRDVAGVHHRDRVIDELARIGEAIAVRAVDPRAGLLDHQLGALLDRDRRATLRRRALRGDDRGGVGDASAGVHLRLRHRVARRVMPRLADIDAAVADMAVDVEIGVAAVAELERLADAVADDLAGDVRRSAVDRRGLVEQEGCSVAGAGARRVDAPFLVAAAGAVAAALRAELRKQRDVAMGGVVDEVAVRDEHAHVALAASRREPGVDRDPVVAALIEVVGQVVGMSPSNPGPEA